jgi:hypothetical protein
MPHSELHSRRQRKNIAVALGVCAFIVMVFVITVVRLKAGSI